MGYLEYTLVPATPENMPPEMVGLLAFWSARRGDAFAPRWEDFKLYELPAAVVPLIVVVDLDPARDRISYRFWGTGRTQLYGRDNTGRDVRESLPDQAGQTVAEQYAIAVKARGPVLFRNVYPLKPAARSVCLTLRLPLSSDGETVDKMVSYSVVTENPDVFTDYVNPEARRERR